VRVSLALIPIILCCFFPSPLMAGDDEARRLELEEALSAIEEQRLELEIHARVRGENRESVWTTKTRELTVSGKSVAVTLAGENLLVRANLIPFVNADESIFLVAKGEVWIQEEEGEEKKYYSTIKSLPIEAGESVIFFPMGVLMDSEKENVYIIELEIQVEPLK